MPAETREEFPHRSLRCHWPQVFTQRRPLNCYSRQAENQPYVEYLQTNKFAGEDDEGDLSDEEEEEIDDNNDDEDIPSEDENEVKGNEGNVETKKENPNDDKNASACNGQSIVRLFMVGMTDDEETLQYPDQVEQVASFYELNILDNLEKTTSQGSRAVALLDDRNICGAIRSSPGPSQCTETWRQHPGPLTSKKLLEELSRKRFRLEPDQNVATKVPDSLERDVDRRLIFIAGLDPATIEVLTRTASRTQAPALRYLLYKHLTGKASLGVTIPAQGFRVFTLDFHIPYFVLRVNQELVADSRKKSGGGPLRKSRILPLLSRSPDGPTSTGTVYSLYEAQMSVVVTGIDHWVWVAYGLFETYFETNNMAAHYDQLNGTRGRRKGRADPLAAGRIDADQPIWTPREYYFKVVEIQMNQVLREWNGVFSWVEKEVKQSRTHHGFPPPSNKHKIEQVREFCEWNSQMVNILRDLITGLSDTVGAWDEFRRNDIGYFQENDKTPNPSSSLSSSVTAVGRTFSTLKALLSKLEDLEKKLCSDNPQGLNALLSLQNHEATMFQQRTGRHIQVFTVVTILFLPLGLDAALFSATGVLPLTPNLAHFTYVLLCLVVAVGASLLVLFQWHLFQWHLWSQPVLSLANFIRNAMIYSGERRGKEEAGDDISTSSRIWKRGFLSRGVRRVDDHELRDLEMQTETRRNGELD